MNQGGLQSSPVQQMVVAAGSPNWWSINNMKPPIHRQHHSSAAATPHSHLPHQLTPPWDDVSQEPESWSQFLLGGSVGEEDTHDLSHAKAKKMENWDQKLLNQSSNSYFVDLKQENTASGYTYGPINEEFQAAKPTNYWSHNMVSSPPKSCTTTLSSNLFDFSRQSSDMKHTNTDLSSECNSTATGRVAKKARIQPSSGAQSPFKVRKEKLGDKITALHQIVCPFGKTDTASVLLEAIGYIRFLQSQVEALSLPYLGSGSGNMRHKNMESDEEAKVDLKSKGLCLVPVSCTLHFGSDNGADYWAPSLGANLH